MGDFLHSRLIFLKNLGFYPRVVLDIGAHKGEWRNLVHLVWPKAKVFMIEANEEHRRDLKTAVGRDGYEIALLGDENREKVSFYAAKIAVSTGNSIFLEQTHFFDDYEVRKLPMVTLDLLVKKRKLTQIDFVKIDTQGSELNILRGGVNVIKKAEFVLLETKNLEYNLGAPDVSEVMAEMKKLGLALFDITEIHYLPTGEMMQVDMLFAKVSSKFIRKGKLA